MDVSLVRWPVESARRDELAARGAMRLLLVENDATPPEPADCLEDWIRVPAPEPDIRARLAALEARRVFHAPSTPTLDTDGVLRFHGALVSLPPIEARLMTALVGRFGCVVGRETLARAGWPAGSPGRNALDVHVLRRRRRLDSVGLLIRTVRSRGYLLEASGSVEQRVREA